MAPRESIGLERFNELPDDEVVEALLACCSSQAWASYIAGRRPYSEISQLHEVAADALALMGESDLDEALAGHSRIGETTDAAFSGREQSGVAGATAQTLDALTTGNRQYEERFGHVYLVCATGRTAEELLKIMHDRLDNDPAAERRAVRTELGKINRIRIDRLIGPGGMESS